MRRDRPFEAALEDAVTHLDNADRRLAHEIAAGVLRTRDELDGHLMPLVSGDWHRTPADLKDLLRIGAYQALRLSRVPGYAAVQTTVEVAKGVAGAKGARLVNAVLRRLVDGAAQGETTASTADLAGRYSHPAWLVDRWTERYGTHKTEALLRHNNERPRLVLQPARQTVDQLRAALMAEAVPFHDAPFGTGLVVEARRVPGLPGFEAGAFIVQDPAQARLVEFAAIPEGSVVWDACAAPGGKAVLLSHRCRRVIACDSRRDRAARLKETVTRAAVGVSLLLADACRPPIRAGSIDAVVVDAPCSATGTMARHPDARWRLSPRRLAQLAQLQAQILDGVAPTVRPAGLLVYMTCSLEPEENEEQVDRFLERRADFLREGGDLFIFPPDAGTDGGYATRLRRVA